MPNRGKNMVHRDRLDSANKTIKALQEKVAELTEERDRFLDDAKLYREDRDKCEVFWREEVRKVKEQAETDKGYLERQRDAAYQWLTDSNVPDFAKIVKAMRVLETRQALKEE